MARKGKSKAKRKGGLRAKQRAFVDYYLQTWNASEAARLAGYSPDSAGSIGHENLKKPEIEAEIESRLKALTMSADEVLYRLTEHGRGNLAEFAGLSVDQLKAHPKSWLLKEIEVTRLHVTDELLEETVKLKIHDPQAALVHLGRHHKLFTDKHEHTGKDGEQLIIAITKMDIDEL